MTIRLTDEERKKRNELVVKDYLHGGFTHRVVGLRHKITSARSQQIVARYLRGLYIKAKSIGESGRVNNSMNARQFYRALKDMEDSQ